MNTRAKKHHQFSPICTGEWKRNPRKSHPKGREIVEESNLLRRKHTLWNVSTQERGGSLRVRRRNKQYSPRPCPDQVTSTRNGRPNRTNQEVVLNTLRTFSATL